MMKSRMVMNFAIAALGLSTMGAIFALPESAAASDSLKGREVRIGAIVPSSGPFAEWGKTNTVALQMLEKSVNDSGGIEGAKLKIFIYDDAARPAQAANLVRKLASDDKVLAIAGPLTSSTVEVAFPVANDLKIVAMSQASAKPGVAAANRPWGFRNTIDEGTLAETVVPYFKKTYDIKSVAIIYDAKDAVSTSIGTKVMPPIMEKNGVKVLNINKPISFNTGDIDVSAQVTTLKSLNPDGVVIGADYSQAISILREMKRQGFVRPVVGGTPLISSAILAAAREVPIVAPATYYAGIQGAKAEKFTKNMQPRLKEGGLASHVEPSMYDVNIYEIVSMYIQAVEKAGIAATPETLAVDRERIMKYLTDLKNFQGVLGPISFDKSGEAIKTFFVVLGENGKWTEKVRGCSGASVC
jgi:branched-chain amino acid transport system substrate-binding protein